MYILGISAFYHDSAAALIKDGRVVAAAAEERFSRIKHDNQFPTRAIYFCLAREGIEMRDIDRIAYYEKPLLKFERFLESCAGTYPFSFRPFSQGINEWFSGKLHVEKNIREAGYAGTIMFVPHHLSHAAAAWYPSLFSDSAIVTIDGVGEYQTTAIWHGTGTAIRHLASLHFPHSLGLLYSTITSFLGFEVNNDEYKVMGLAGHGTPAYLTELSRLVACEDDGSFKLNLEYFGFRESLQMWSRRLEDLLGAPRPPGSPITRREKNIAASLQALTESIYVRILTQAHKITKSDSVCIAGGVALNAAANGKIFSQTPFKHVYILGVAGDDGAALGAALYAYYHAHPDAKRMPIDSLALGSAYDDTMIRTLVREKKAAFTEYDERSLVETVAGYIAEGNIVGWFQGSMEFGPRALGNRSILADPRNLNVRAKLNALKNREDFHPFAGAVLESAASDLFELPSGITSFPFMAFCFPVRENVLRKIPAIVHADQTCRIQTVRDGIFASLLHAFEQKTGIPCLLNTSFNRKGEPIVEDPVQAIDDFYALALDHLVIGRTVISR